MRKLLLLFVISLFLPLSSVFSQTFEDYVLEFRGDTAVIKDFFDFTPNEKNTLYQALTLDASPPAGRVYMLKTTGYYPLTNNPTTLRATIIVGEDPTIMVNNTNSAFPPLICGALIEGQDPNTGGINFAHNLTVKNCNIIPAAAAGALGWNFFDCQAADVRLTLQNNLFERTRWVFMASGQENVKFYIKDNYFVNMNGQACRRNGGVLDEFARQDTLWVENNTHVMAQGLIYKFRSNQFNRIVFNHNTFVNMGNLVFLDLGSQSQMSVTNNMFINCNIQPYVGAGHTIDDGEEDKEHLPIGIVNFIADTAVHVERKILAHKNLVYWDSRFDDMVDILNNNQVNNSTDWISQMITMNTRTQAAFDDDATYPYLTEGDWIEAVPTFTKPEDLLTTQVDNLKAFGLATLDTNDVTTTLPDWRLVNTGGDPDYLYSDWPIPVDLSYSDASLLNAGYGGYPLGDLNWFPSTKSNWSAQKNAEYSQIHNELETGVLDVEQLGGLPVEFELQQNYPNPFNPTTKISFSIPQAGNVVLKVYNSIGKEVATLVNGYMTAQSYKVDFNASGFASGIYIYKLEYDNSSISKKMVLLK